MGTNKAQTEISLLKENDSCNLSDLELISKFYDYLTRKEGLKLNSVKAFSIIHYLQEHVPVFPDTIEICHTCKTLYNSENEGFYSNKTSKFYCGDCESKAPEIKKLNEPY